MAEVTLNGSSLGSALTEFLLADDLVPGHDPSYQTCKTIYLYHPLGPKMVDGPIKLAQSQERVVSVPDSPGERIVDAFRDEWKRMQCDSLIANLGGVARTYGLGTIVLGAEGVAPDVPIKPERYADLEMFFNVVDPLNTAGSIVQNQDPNSPTFQKRTDVSVAGTVYHRSRAITMMHGKPVYIAYTSSGFGYVGRSVYQPALYPLKTFVQTMITDDAVTAKAALLIAKIQPAGSIVDRLQAGFTALKRQMLKGARTGNVLSISAGTTSANAEDITTLNMMNVDGAGGWARTNVLKNISTAADMPAKLLENETLTEGFGEGTEEAKYIAKYVDGIREWLQPAYDFFDPVVMRRAWNERFYATIQRDFPEEYGGMDYNTAFWRWANSFSATWPNYLEEPPSEKVKVAETKLDALVSVVQVLLPIADPENKANIVQFLADNINADKVMFTSPLNLDLKALAEYVPPEAAVEEGAREPQARRPMGLGDSDGSASRRPRREARWGAGG